MTHHIETIIRSLQPVRSRPNGHIAHCPAHDDHDPSLTITYGARGLLFKCMVGCTTKAVLDAYGLTFQQIFYDYDPDKYHTRPDIQTRYLALQHTLNPPPERILPFDRLDDVIWTTYPTTLEHLSAVSIQWYPFFRFPFAEIKARWVEMADGPIFDYYLPRWVADGEPDWKNTKYTILRHMEATWEENQPTRGLRYLTTVT